MPTYSAATDAFFTSRHIPEDRSEGAILTRTWLAHYGADRIDVPEKKLLFGLFKAALMGVAQVSVTGCKHRRHNSGATYWQRRALREAAEDREWFEDRDRWDPWSFNFVWSTLFPEWDLERARRSILEHPELIRARIEAMEQVDEEILEEFEN